MRLGRANHSVLDPFMGVERGGNRPSPSQGSRGAWPFCWAVRYGSCSVSGPSWTLFGLFGFGLYRSYLISVPYGLISCLAGLNLCHVASLIFTPDKYKIDDLKDNGKTCLHRKKKNLLPVSIIIFILED